MEAIFKHAANLIPVLVLEVLAELIDFVDFGGYDGPRLDLEELVVDDSDGGILDVIFSLLLEGFIIEQGPNVVDEAHATNNYLLRQRLVRRLIRPFRIGAVTKLVKRMEFIVSF